MNQLYYGDNLKILREHIQSESVDLTYLDPPFNSNANYNVLFKSPTGEKSHAQIEAFEDTWHWTEEAQKAFDEVMQSGNTSTADLLRAMQAFLGDNDMMAYLAMMSIRMIELHRVLKESGSIYLHCDPTASHYLKLLMDSVFGADRFLNEIIWKRTHAHGSSVRFGPVHDVILFYSKSNSYTWTHPRIDYTDEYVSTRFRLVDPITGKNFTDVALTGSGTRNGESGQPWRGINPTEKGRHWALPGAILGELGIVEGTLQERLDALDQAGLVYWPEKENGIPRLKWFADRLRGQAVPDTWTDISPINSQARERLRYPTQKPVALLERIIQASSKEGDLVLDPFCGCGTTIHAAQKLKRQWVGIDITSLAIGLIKDRIHRAFPEAQFKIERMPEDLDGARDLAAHDKYQFQWWAISLIPGAHPYKGKKKGPDSGIDGLVYFKPDMKTTEKGIISVKGGENIGVDKVRELAHVCKRERAQVGLFITLTEPTKPMRTEAIKEGFYETAFGKFPRLQIMTIEQLLQGELPRLPPTDESGLRRAVREVKEKQQGLSF